MRLGVHEGVDRVSKALQAATTQLKTKGLGIGSRTQMMREPRMLHTSSRDGSVVVGVQQIVGDRVRLADHYSLEQDLRGRCAFEPCLCGRNRDPPSSVKK